MGPPEFIFVTCQIGAEAALKAELARDRPTFRFAYSRPGFLTFKLPPDHGLHDTCDLGSVFARAAGFSLGKASGATAEERTAALWQLAGPRPYNRLHVWQRGKGRGVRDEGRDEVPLPLPPDFGELPSGLSLRVEDSRTGEGLPAVSAPNGGEAEVLEAEQAILALWPAATAACATGQRSRPVVDASRSNSLKAGLQQGATGQRSRPVERAQAEEQASAPRPSPLTPHASLPHAPQPGAATRPGDLVLDCLLIEPDQWWLGFHRAHDAPSCRPGGLFNDPLPPEAVSRAYLKMEEALAWSRLPVRRGDLFVEIGSAPGGSAQALLRRGARVIGIDPADMDPRVLTDPNFAHWKMRGMDVRRREFRGVRWLSADMNVAPQYTLDTVEAIVTHESVHVAGMLLTLKLPDWSLAAEIPQYLDRIRSWGFKEVLARQLHQNRHEICIAALSSTGRRRQLLVKQRTTLRTRSRTKK